MLPALTALPQSTRGIRACRCHPPLVNPRENWATVSLSVFSFSSLPFPMFFHGWFSNKIAILLPMSTALPRSTKGIRAHHCHPMLINIREKQSTVSLFGFSIFFPPIPNVFYGLFFQLNCYIVASVDDPPSFYKGNKSPSLPSPTRESQREEGDSEFVCLFFIFFLPIPNLFSWVIFE